MASFLSTYGKGIYTGAVVGLGATSPKYVGWGTGSGQTVASTNLATPAAPTATTGVTGAISQVTVTTTNDTVQVTATITAGGALSITEAGTFDSATLAAHLMSYSDFAVITLANADSISFTSKTTLT